MPTTEGFALDRDTIARVDVSDQLTDILAIPEHLRDALWKVESAGLDSWDSPGGIIVAGMGGSAIGGELARAILGDHASRPLITARAYGLPPWTTNETTVVCASYSGDTEETLTCYEAAGVIDARRVVVTSGGKLAELARADGVPVIPLAGGYQPRAAVAYLTVAVLEVAALSGVGPRMNSEIDVAADHLEELVIEWGPEGADETEAKALPPALNGTGPVIAGAGPRPGPPRARAGPRGPRPHDRDRLPLEDADQREREGARVLAGAAGDGPQRDRGVVLGRRARALLGRVPRRRRHAPARQGAHRPHEPPDPAGRGRGLPRPVPRAHDRRARVLARAARRSRVALPRRPAGRRSRARRVAPRAQDRARAQRLSHRARGSGGRPPGRSQGDDPTPTPHASDQDLPPHRRPRAAHRPGRRGGGARHHPRSRRRQPARPRGRRDRGAPRPAPRPPPRPPGPAPPARGPT